MVKRPLRVLIVEDEALVAMLIEDVLAELGHEVVGVGGRMERALQLAKTAECDLAIVDLNLNGERTYPIAHELRARGVPIVFATGYDAAGVDPEWRATPMLHKPFEPGALEAAIAQALL